MATLKNFVRRVSGASSSSAANKRLSAKMYETGDDIQSEISKLKEEVDQVSKEVKDLEDKRGRQNGKLNDDDKEELKAKRAERDALNIRIAAAYAKETQLSKERPLWDVLAQIPQRALSIPGGSTRSKKERVEQGVPENLGGGKITDTTNWPAPHAVEEVDYLAPRAIDMKERAAWYNMVENDKFPNASNEQRCMSEAGVGGVLSSFLLALLSFCAAADLLPKLTPWSEQPSFKHGFRPDFLIEKGDEGYVLVIELKPEWKWGVTWEKELQYKDSHLATEAWRIQEIDDLKTGVKASPIRQQLTYMLGLRLRYGILTTYTHWWFLEYEGRPNGTEVEMILKTSRPIAYDEQDPSMAQYVANHLLKCCGKKSKIPDSEIPLKALEQLDGWKEFKKKMKTWRKDHDEPDGAAGGGGGAAGGGGGAAGGGGGGAAGGGGGGAGSSSGNGPGGGNASGGKSSKKGKKGKKSSKKDKKDDKNGAKDSPIITETLGTSRTGVSWKVDYLGYTSVVKVADVFKQPDLIEELEQEQHVYTTLSKLQGFIIPHFIGLCDFQCGRLGIATLYAGEPLQRYIKDTECGHDVRLEIARKCISNLDSIHEQRVHHGDIRAENIVVDEDGTPRFIDFAFSEINIATPEEYARERSSLIEMLKKELKLDETFIAQTNDMSLDIQMKFQ